MGIVRIQVVGCQASSRFVEALAHFTPWVAGRAQCPQTSGTQGVGIAGIRGTEKHLTFARKRFPSWGVTWLLAVGWEVCVVEAGSGLVDSFHVACCPREYFFDRAAHGLA